MTDLTQRIQLHHGDITTLDVDAVVTAANSGLRGGGGVDGAVHRAAGPELVKASMALAPCGAGQAKITPGFDLSAPYVIHAVGPIFADLDNDGPTLASAYKASLALAEEQGIDTIAFPCISTGAYGFPPEPACEIAVDMVVGWLKTKQHPNVVTFCCFEADDYELYRKRLETLGFDT